MKFSRFLFVFLLPFLLTDCQVSNDVTSSGSFQKRKYRKGWHVDLGKKPTQDKTITKTEPLPPNTGGLKNQVKLPKQLPLLKGSRPVPQECDIVTKRNGDEIKAKVLKIGPELVEYKKCGREDGPTYTIRKSNIFMIKYPDGEKDVFDQQPTKEPEKDQSQERFPEKKQTQESKKEATRKEAKEKEESGNNAWDVIGFILSLIATLLFFIALLAPIPLSNALGIMTVAITLGIQGIITSAIGDGGLGDAGLTISIITVSLAIISILLLFLALSL